jgi:hypothetical protein
LAQSQERGWNELVAQVVDRVTSWMARRVGLQAVALALILLTLPLTR